MPTTITIVLYALVGILAGILLRFLWFKINGNNSGEKQVMDIAQPKKTKVGTQEGDANIQESLDDWGATSAVRGTTAQVILLSADNCKLAVVKTLKECMELGLKEAKDIVDDLPQVVAKDTSKEKAEMIKACLVEAGAEVEIR